MITLFASIILIAVIAFLGMAIFSRAINNEYGDI
jgi:hypothetical protein